MTTPAIQQYLAATAASGSPVTLSTSSAQAGWWLVAVQGWDVGQVDDLPDRLGGTAGEWERIAFADAGLGQPKIQVWARRVTTTGPQTVTWPAGVGSDQHCRVYVCSGVRAATAERAFEAYAVAASGAVTAHRAPSVWAPDEDDLLVCVWMTGTAGATNYTLPGSMTPRPELDLAGSTSRSAEQTLTGHGATGARTATAAAARPYAAVSIAVRGNQLGPDWPRVPMRKRVLMALGVDPGVDPGAWADAWTDVTTYTRARDDITIGRGRPDESSVVPPSKLTLTVDNTAGRFTRRNPAGPYYGRLRKNTPIRIWIDTGQGWDLRATQFITEFPPRSPSRDQDQHMPLQAAGPLRRLGQGQALRGALYRGITGGKPFSAYWPLEDSDGATIAASGLPTGNPMISGGEVTFGTGGAPAGSTGAASFGVLGRLYGAVTGMPTTTPGGWIVSYWLEFPPDIVDATDYSVLVDWQTPRAATRVRWILYISPGSAGRLSFGGFDASNDSVVTFLGTRDLRPLGPAQITVHAHQSGSNLIIDLYVNGVLDGTTTAADTAGPVAALSVNSYYTVDIPAKGSISHVLVATADRLADVLALLPAGSGYAGERAAARISRLATEEDLPVAITGPADQSQPMGAQPVGTLLDLLRDCETADLGVLYERRDGRLGYQVRAKRYGAPITVAMDYDASHITPPLEPTDDDQAARNDIEASRTGGSSARVIDQTSVNQIGRYDDAVTVNVANDAILDDVAGWLVHLGTVDQLRFPVLSPALRSNPALAALWAGVDIGDRITIANPPSDLPPETIDQFTEGYSESFGLFRWDLEANCSPATPWDVGVLDDTLLGKLDTDGSALTAAVSATATTLTVTVLAGPLWTTDPAQCPIRIAVDGEHMTATAITGTSNPQTFTVVRGANGVTKPHDPGADLRLAHPLTLAL